MAVHVKKGPVKKNGRQSLFLLIYNKSYHPHKPLRKSLDTFVYASPKTLEEKQHNKERLMFAEKVKMQEEADFDAVGGGIRALQSQGSFSEYFKKLMDEKRNVEGSYTTWKATYRHLMFFLNGWDIKLNECDDVFLNAFKRYLEKCKSIKSPRVFLSKNSANLYFTKVKVALNEAVRNRIILDNPTDRVRNIKVNETFRVYLTKDEISKLNKSQCKIPILKKAFIFSCYTGLRWSDVYKLKWDEIKYFKEEKIWKIEYRQYKTQTIHYLPIAEQTMELLGVRGRGDEKVFKGLKYSAYHNQVLEKWVREQGINKHITFHCARHSYAIIMLMKTKNIVVLSKFLGHTNIKTTQIYAKVTNPEMNEAVDLFWS